MSADLESILLDRQKLVIGDEIGHGGYGIVYKATYDGKPCAAKTIKDRLYGPDLQEIEKSVSRDISMPTLFNHPALLPLIGYVPAERVPETEEWNDRKGFITVMPLLQSKNVYQMARLEQNDPDRLPDTWPTTKSKCIFGMAAGLEHMHSRGVLHRDFKLQNVLLTENGDPCIADFGLSRVQSIVMSCQQATPFMTAPEIIEFTGTYTEKVDVYAYGVALYQLFSNNMSKLDNGRKVIANHAYAHQLWTAVSRGARFARDPKIPDYIWDLIQRCWDHSPMKRPAMRDIVRELHQKTYIYAAPGTDMNELKRYEESLMSLIHEEEEEYQDETQYISSVPFK